MTSVLSRQLSLLLLLCLPIAGFAQPQPVEVKLVLHAQPPPGSAIPVMLEARPSSHTVGAGKVESRQTRSVAPGSARLDLSRAAEWRITASAEGYWSPEVMASAQSTGPVTLDLWPAGKVFGSVEVDRGEKAPPELSVRFTPSSKEEAAIPAGERTTLCPVAEQKWTCTIPAGRFDLRLRARGFISHFLWGTRVEAGKTLDLGRLALRRGASVVGRVEVAEGKPAFQDCKVELSPLSAGPTVAEGEAQRRAGLALTAPVDQRGFFHFEGVPPGAYVLTARKPGYAPAEIHPVSVMEMAESEVRQPLVLLRPLTMEVRLDPALDPWHNPWRLLIEKESSIPGTLERLEGGVASREGIFSRGGLSPGSYYVEVQDSRGASFAWETLALDRGSPPLDIRLPLVWIEGTVLLGKEPLPAELWFGGSAGAVKIQLSSDSEGEFAGVLPREGTWEVDVESESPRIRRRLRDVEVRVLPQHAVARVALELPDTRVAGEVVDEKGDPVRNARVTAFELQTARPTFLNADERGRFEAAGLPVGPLSLRAEAAGLQSEETFVQLAEGMTPPSLRLVLRKVREVSGTLSSPAGGVPGARLIAIAMTGSGSLLPSAAQTTTDVEGRFRLEAPAGAAGLQILALAPGFAVLARRFQGVPQEALDLRVSPLGGTLHLTPGGPADPSDPAAERLSVWINGAVLDATLLEMWAGMNGLPRQQSSALTIPQLPPGEYVACWAPLEGSLQSLGTGGPPPGAACDRGSLVAGGDLALERPAGSERATPR